MAPARRIERPVNCPLPRGEEVQFQFEGRSLTGYDREPLAVALLANGVRVFGRSIKYHRPRGPLCLLGNCTGCLMRVDGMPSVRTCEINCRSGQVVERQTGWPGSGRDIFRIMDWVYGERLDHHGMFTASGSINRMAMRFVRKMAGFGHPPTADLPPHNPVDHLRADAVVVGAGVAGLAAAMALAEAGVPVIQFERSDKIGGRMLDATCRLARADGEPEPGWLVREDLKGRYEALRDIELHQETPVVAIYPHPERPQVLATNDRETMVIEAKRLVVANGAYDLVPLFENNDIPGIFTRRALDRLTCVQGVVPAEPVLVVGNRSDTLRLALALHQAKVRVAGVATASKDEVLLDSLREAGLTIFADKRLIRARGGRWLNRVELAGRDGDEEELVIDCGMMAVEAPDAPAYELAHHAGCRVEFSTANGYRVVCDEQGQTSDARIFAAGHCTGAVDASQAHRQGRAAGLACALSLKDDPALRQELEALTAGGAEAK